jgi:magnesium-transporting ATPase (P-type)
MLTGDKQETAINIAYSCGLFQVLALEFYFLCLLTPSSELHGNVDC